MLLILQSYINTILSVVFNHGIQNFSHVSIKPIFHNLTCYIIYNTNMKSINRYKETLNVVVLFWPISLHKIVYRIAWYLNNNFLKHLEFLSDLILNTYNYLVNFLCFDPCTSISSSSSWATSGPESSPKSTKALTLKSNRTKSEKQCVCPPNLNF